MFDPRLRSLTALTCCVVLAATSGCGPDVVADAAPQIPYPYGAPEVEFVSGPSSTTAPLADLVEASSNPASREGGYFNGSVRKTLESVEITGLEVVFDPRDDRHELNRYDGSPNIASMVISAERVIVRDRLNLPGVDLTIQAGVLQFEDVEGLAPAAIDTKTLPRDPALPRPAAAKWVKDRRAFPPIAFRRVRGTAGTPGERGGNLAILVGEVRLPDGNKEESTPRILQGGSPGTPGGAPTQGKCYPASTITDLEKNWFRQTIRGTGGGAPGRGGDSGALVYSLPNLLSIVERSPGIGGVTPGIAGKKCRLNASYVRKGFPTAGPPIAPVEAEPGQLLPPENVELSTGGWADPGVLRLAVRRIEDDYRAQRLDSARELALRVLEWAPYLTSEEPLTQREIDSHRTRLYSMAESLVGGLDYFGNPQGWVPLLSLEANYSTYAAESQEAVRAMLMTHWLEEYWSKQDDRIQSLQWAIEQNEAEVESQRERLQNARALLPRLESESERLRKEMRRYMAELKSAEDRILKKVSRREAGKDIGSAALTAIGTVAMVVAFSNPGTAAVAIGVMAAGAGGAELMNRPGGEIHAGGASDSIGAILDEEEVESARQRLAEMDLFASSDTDAVVFELQSIGEDLRKATRRYVEQTMAAAAPTSADFDAQAELTEMLAEDEEFQRIFNGVVALVTAKKVFHEKLVETRAAIDDSVAAILEASWTVESLQAALRENQSQLDPSSRNALRQMRRRAKDRLVRYQYYLAKSFEYRLLQPCPVDLEANRVYERIESLFSISGSKDPSQTESPPLAADSPLVEDLVRIYQEDLSRIAEITIEGLESDRFDPVAATYTLELTPAELETLNRDSVVSIDLGSHALIFESDRNARIANIEVDPSATRFRAGGTRGQYAAHLDLTIEPAERSFIRWDDTAYGFNFRRPQYTNIVMYGYSWRAPDGPGNPMRLADESRSLMATLVDSKFGDTSRVDQVHFRPSAHGSIVIRKEVSATSGSLEIQVENLALTVEIEKNKSYERQKS